MGLVPCQLVLRRCWELDTARLPALELVEVAMPALYAFFMPPSG